MSRKFLTGIDVNSQKITSLADPTGNTDAANKQYVDNVARGLQWKQSVKAATTTNGTLATAYANGQTIDGVTLATGDRILLKNQSTGSENGIYVVAASGAPSRAADLATGSSADGIAVTVEQGTANGDKVYMCTNDLGSAVVNTAALVFSQLGGGTTYTAGNGLTGTTTFSVLANGTSIDVSASGVKIADAAAGNGLGVASGVLSVNVGTGLEISADNVRLAAATGTGLTGGGASALAVDTAVVARYVEVSSAAAQTTVVTHNFGRAGVQVQCYDPTGFNIIEADVTNRTTNACTVDFGAAVSAGQYKIVVVG